MSTNAHRPLTYALELYLFKGLRIRITMHLLEQIDT
ncbi:hypothetical protein T12_9756 [Trichinella patagoniensis]|uniref:Uncharacterized protein n=1 Tax=Trichinella patagoniensis TaxID=990121 RepID=A0A0V0XV28_9BILA|nr:hypothetical protein T12_9756 [Trichinella patagoniensis]